MINVYLMLYLATFSVELHLGKERSGEHDTVTYIVYPEQKML
jgi:hypothetical protein